MASSNILAFASQYSLYTNFFTFSIGLIGNALNILVFTYLKCFRHNRCALYLTIESTSNFINQLVFLILTIATAIYGANVIGNSLIWCRFRYMMSQSCSLIASTMICLAACDQFFSTNYRFNTRQTYTLKLARCFVFISICVWFLHSILFSFFLDIQPLSGCVITNPAWLEYSTFFFYPVLIGFLPIMIASSFSLLAYRNVRRIIRRQVPIERRRLDRQITAMVLFRVLFFVFCILPYSGYRIYIINSNINQAHMLQYAIIQLISAIFVSLMNLNCAISFYIFIISSSRYRRQVKYILVRKCWRKLKNYFSIQENQVCPENTVSSRSNIELE